LPEHTPQISVVLPLFRNAVTLPELYERLRKTLELHEADFELIFVDDACPEDSGRVVLELATHDERVRLVSLPRNVGQHSAVLAGLGRARGTWTAVMDADLQDPPEAIPHLLEEATRTGAPIVFAGRRGRYESRFRLLTSRVFKRALAALARVPPDAGLFVILARPVVERLLELDGRRPYVTAMIGCTGFGMVSVPVVRAARPSGESAYRFRDRLTSAGRAFGWITAWRLRSLRAR
jgi:glycosyltransferase involved in cell wall biosynthesis